MQTGADRRADGANTVSDGPGASTRILLASHDGRISEAYSVLLARCGYAVDVVKDGTTALAKTFELHPAAVVMTLDMADLTGPEICRRLQADPRTRLIPVILLTANDSIDARVKGLDAGAHYVVRVQRDCRELLASVRAVVHLKRYTDDLESSSTVMITLAAMIESRDGYSEGHCHRMANYSVAIGRSLGLPDADLHVLRRGAFLHDIGMLTVPDAILHKTAPLTAEEYAQIRNHTVMGEALIANLRSLHAVAPGIRHHHERRDGSGYPDGLRGDDIPLFAQIIGVVDVFEAATSHRSYRPACTVAEATSLLREQVRLGWWRRDLVERFLTIIGA